ncbi:hypothetical protein [Pectobacterium punjabense]|uniref:hypothetical protein n=1 Tax=Pectobacterium punjabense TaxID=2108399 RepID=UPI00380D851A
MNRDVRLVKVIADLAIFLEFTDDNHLDPDIAVDAMEQMAAELQLLDEKEKDELINIFKYISSQYEGDKCEYVRDLPESLGLA